MIWEDMHSNGVSQGSQEQELKFIRHFVSHGAALQDRRLIEFLEREIQPGTRQYDPSNQSHRAFIERRREWARRLVEDQVNGYLS